MVDKVTDSIQTHTTVQNDQRDYIPVQPYWFHSRKIQDHITWIPFSLIDVKKLEQGYSQSKIKLEYFSIIIFQYNNRKKILFKIQNKKLFLPMVIVMMLISSNVHIYLSIGLINRMKFDVQYGIIQPLKIHI